MIQSSFLDHLASQIIADYSSQLSDLVIILPNKRAKIFLLEALKKQITTTIFSPEITSIEDFVQDISNLRKIDSIELLFEFYEIYLQLQEIKIHQSFDLFANWAVTLLQDFNEIDRYLLDPFHILSYLKDIDDIKKWGIDPTNKTALLENYINFWKLLPLFYKSLQLHLITKGIGYQGLISREAVKNVSAYANKNENTKYIFAGFNALNPSEEKIIQYLLAQNKAKIYWDSEQTFLNDNFHDAGLFIRNFKSNWKHYKANPFEWIFDSFSGNKNIHIIGTPKSIGQAKITGSIIDSLIADNPAIELNSVAVVLGDENLLLPILNSLPNSITDLNITMGYLSKNNPIQLLISKLFKMHKTALKNSSGQYVFYYKDVLGILTHPLLENYIMTRSLVEAINTNNLTFIPHKKLYELQALKSELFLLIFAKWENEPISVLLNILKIIQIIKGNLATEDDRISNAFLYSIFKTINQLINYLQQNSHVNDIDTLFSIYKQTIELAEVSFEGEPLQGLQIMGVLESRVLDFETVIITSVNEGKFPAGKGANSFIPFDLKKEYGLPTYKEKDAIYTYHFYHLLQRAKNIYLIYNTESDGFDSGEKSRFITQLEVEKQPNHNITHEIFNAVLPETAFKPVIISKSPLVVSRLQEIAVTGYSPTTLTSYIRNPLDFYFQKVLKINEADQVEENIALKTLGTIIHGSLEALYTPFIGVSLTESHLKQCFQNLNTEVLKQFNLVYKEGNIKKGKNLLAFEVAKRHIFNFLNYELQSIKNGDAIKILFLEKNCERLIIHQNLPFPVKIQGKVDRIEERNGVIRIVDYKTGKVESKNLVLKSWSGLTLDIKNEKIIQILAYAYMYNVDSNAKQLEAGIISFKNMKAGFLPFQFKTPTGSSTNIDEEILNSFINELVILIAEILNTSIDFAEKK